jgi:hypothetical protein
MTENVNLYDIEARAAAATEGPWEVRRYEAAAWGQKADVVSTAAESPPVAADPEEYMGACMVADAEFIAHARTDVPDLVARVRKLEAAIARVRADLPDGDDYYEVPAEHVRGLLEGTEEPWSGCPSSR